jgi:hypothetical protein
MFKPSRCASSGYFESNREKLRRAREGETFGKALGFLPISASAAWLLRSGFGGFQVVHSCLFSSGGTLRSFR